MNYRSEAQANLIADIYKYVDEKMLGVLQIVCLPLHKNG